MGCSLQESVVWEGLPREPGDYQNAVFVARGVASVVLRAGGLTGWVGSKGFSRAQGPQRQAAISVLMALISHKNLAPCADQ